LANSHTSRECRTLNLRCDARIVLKEKAEMVYTLVVHLYANEDKESQDKLVKKLQEASQVYTNDKETLGW
jgi:transcriptional regulator NrdR family protein